MTQEEKAAELRRLHEAPELLVVPNVWDAASARTVAALDGCRALATASWAIAAAHGFADGELIGPREMCEAVENVARSVDLPVTADLEAGYGDAGYTVAMALEAGAVGCNLEDENGDPDEHVYRVGAARAAGEEAGVPLVINARTDVFLGGTAEVEDAIVRGLAYLEAGGDCVFVPGAHEPDDLRALGAAFGGRLSVLAWPGWKAGPLSGLAALGVARVTVGPGLMGAAYAALRGAAESLLALEDLPADLAFRPPVA